MYIKYLLFYLKYNFYREILYTFKEKRNTRLYIINIFIKILNIKITLLLLI